MSRGKLMVANLIVGLIKNISLYKWVIFQNHVRAVKTK